MTLSNETNMKTSFIIKKQNNIDNKNNININLTNNTNMERKSYENTLIY